MRPRHHVPLGLGILPLLVLPLAACGKQEGLRPAEGRTLPVKPALAPTRPTVDQLLAVDPQTRPERSDELLKQSEERRDDRFDLPPPG